MSLLTLKAGYLKMQPSDTSFESEWLSEDDYNKITDDN